MHTGTGTILAATLILASALTLPGTASAVPQGTPAPAIASDTWLNSEPLSMQQLHGKVVLVEFWTFGCWNCRNVEPYIKAWHKRYNARGLTVIGVHAPEFSYEKKLANLKNYIDRQKIEYPIAVDNDFDIWHAWHNRAWPTIYLVDKQGVVRYQRIGEGGYEATEKMIRQLLAEPTSGRLPHPN